MPVCSLSLNWLHVCLAMNKFQATLQSKSFKSHLQDGLAEASQKQENVVFAVDGNI